MRFTTSATLAFLLGAAAGCGTEKVEPDVMFLSDGNAATNTAAAYLEITLAPDATAPRETSYRLRIDGRWVLESPENPVQVMVFSDGSLFRPAAQLAAAPRTIELVSPSGKVALTTAPLTLSGAANQLLVYGDSSALRYYFFANSPAEVDAVPDGSVLVRVINTRPDRQSVDVQSCPGHVGAVGECTPLLSELAYGQSWQQILPRDSVLAVGCSSPGPLPACVRDDLAIACQTVGAETSLVRIKTATFAFADQGYFRSHEVVGTCGFRTDL